ncbi:SMI1-KNR4 cell-wall [Chitinophaga sp. CF118]|uniref:SMI1/KNR4 family protein n=1 Tax=Chitinophaga sp. CF118 TaxID=1884367 RepID=UPI0008F08EE4|nr:SMI1/KNR4 family protein [Chitinophaga sp. CF118]SFD54502.1 SMI1-KNR4 cell-wall [Chitinophaga sp. CF118]
MKYLFFLEPYMEIFGKYEKIQGISETEIENLEIEFKIILPDAYREYLFFFGKESGQLFTAYYTEIKYLLETRSEAIAALNFDDRKTGPKASINEKYFLFGQWQGYVFYFFDCRENNQDPPVYALMDNGTIILHKPSFSIFIKDDGLNPVIESLE